MKSARILTEGAVLLAAFIVLLMLTIYVPLIGIILNLMLPLPFILFAAKHDWKSTVVFVIASLLLSLIAGAIFSFPLIIPYSITGAVMGYLIQKNRSRTIILLTCSIVFLLNLVVLYAVTAAVFHFNFIDEMIKMFKDDLSKTANIMKSLGQQKKTQQTIKQFETALDLIRTLVPSLFVLLSLTYVFIIQLVSLPFLKRFKINVANWKPFREISLPKSLLWYYLVISLIGMLVHPQAGTYWSTAIINLNYILMMLMFFQGLSFIYYFFYQRNASKSFPIIITVMIFLLPTLLFYVVVILGIIDLGFGLRVRFKNKE